MYGFIVALSKWAKLAFAEFIPGLTELFGGSPRAVANPRSGRGEKEN